jgi:hypothetical protein
LFGESLISVSFDEDKTPAQIMTGASDRRVLEVITLSQNKIPLAGLDLSPLLGAVRAVFCN